MISGQDRMLKLMAYADGELDGEDLEEVEGWLAEDAQAARLANELASLGELITVGHAASADAKAVAAFDVADAVMAKIEGQKNENQKSEKKSAPAAVASIADARARAGSTPKRTATGGNRTLKLGGMAAAALALAASVFLMARNKDEQPMARVSIPAVQLSPSPGTSFGPGVDVKVAETPGNSVSVVYLPSETTLTTSVLVWVDESGEKK